MPELVHEFDVRAELTSDEVGSGPFGHRIIVNVVGGKITGDRLNGSIVGAGADWVLLGPDGYGRVDVRYTIRTDDGAHVFVQYPGLLELTPAIQGLLGGGDTPVDYGDQYFFSTPRLETGDERYAWVNQTVFVGQGRVVPGPVAEYRVYRVAN